jgi:hypothetical protein
MLQTSIKKFVVRDDLANTTSDQSHVVTVCVFPIPH